MQKRSGKMAMSCSTNAAAKKARTPTPHQPKVPVLQRAHGDLRDEQLESFMVAIVNSSRFTRYGCDEALQYTEKCGHEETYEQRTLRLPVRRGCGYSSLQLYAHVQDARVRGSYSHFSPYILKNILFTFFSIHHL
jgi:hypothetical protein